MHKLNLNGKEYKGKECTTKEAGIYSIIMHAIDSSSRQCSRKIYKTLTVWNNGVGLCKCVCLVGAYGAFHVAAYLKEGDRITIRRGRIFETDVLLTLQSKDK